MTEQQTGFPKDQMKKIVIYAISIFIINIFLTIIEPTGSTTDLTGQTVSGWAIKSSMIVTLTIGFSIISSIVALLVAIIPYRNLSYGQKYLPALLVTFFGLQLIFLFFEIKYLFIS